MYFSGQHGKLEIASVGETLLTVGRLKSWSYSTQQQTLDTTCLSDVDKTIINGVRSTTGQASLLYYEEALSNVDLIGKNLVKIGSPNAPEAPEFGSSAQQPTLCMITLSLPGGDTGSSKRVTAMYAYITSFSMSCAVSEVVSAEVSWEAQGAPFVWNY
jgi:hypothetical protein